MRRVWTISGLAGLVLAACLGCNSTPKHNDFQTEHPDEIKLPPEGTYTGVPQVPKEYLNQVPPRKDPKALDGLPPAPSMGGGMPAAGRMGGP
jgi:hypothetical protein